LKNLFEMSAKYFDLKNKKILITGGASGIGAALVESFCEQSGSVYFLDINDTLANKLIKKIKQKKLKVPKYFNCDLLNIKELQNTIKKIGNVNVLINNAGNDDRHTIDEITEEYFHNRINLNLKHYLFAAQAVKNGMIKNKSGSIINLSSVNWIRGASGFIVYSTAKSAIFGFTRSLAKELGKNNIRVNAISPGSVATERQTKLWLKPKLKKEILSLQCLKRQLLPKDIANLALFLASDQSSGCTKQNFIVDAGLS